MKRSVPDLDANKILSRAAEAIVGRMEKWALGEQVEPELVTRLLEVLVEHKKPQDHAIAEKMKALEARLVRHEEMIQAHHNALNVRTAFAKPSRKIPTIQEILQGPMNATQENRGK